MMNKQIQQQQQFEGELMPHINGWRLGSPISSRIGAPPETRPYRPMSSQNVRPEQVKRWISQRQNMENIRKEKRKEAIRMERRIAALETATYEMALNAQIQNQAYPVGYIPKPPPSVRNSHYLNKRLPSRNRKNRKANVLRQQQQQSPQTSPKWEQGIIGRLLSKDEKSRCVLYGQRKHEIMARTNNNHFEKKVVKVTTLYEKRPEDNNNSNNNNNNYEENDDHDNSYGENDFEDDVDDEDDDYENNYEDEFENDDDDDDDDNNKEKKKKTTGKAQNEKRIDKEPEEYEEDEDFENEDEEDPYRNGVNFEIEGNANTTNNNNNKTNNDENKNILKRKQDISSLEPPKMFKANWFYNAKKNRRGPSGNNNNNYKSRKKKKHQVASHPYQWDHWKAPELLRVEKALKNNGPPNLLSISLIDKQFEHLINKAKTSYKKKTSKFIYLEWDKVEMAKSYIIEYQNRNNDWIKLYDGARNSCLISAKKLYIFQDDNQLCIAIRSKSVQGSLSDDDTKTQVVNSEYSLPFICPIEKFIVKKKSKNRKCISKSIRCSI